ncbi:MAG: hypothetical protein F4095_01755 [Acidimicrobiia bacterium]|nr:hypothetical protein [Acidimicrobiia bacterium]
MDADGDDSGDEATDDKNRGETAEKSFPPRPGIGFPTGSVFNGSTCASFPGSACSTIPPLDGLRGPPQSPEVKRQANGNNGDETAKSKHGEEGDCEDGNQQSGGLIGVASREADGDGDGEAKYR